VQNTKNTDHKVSLLIQTHPPQPATHPTLNTHETYLPEKPHPDFLQNLFTIKRANHAQQTKPGNQSHNLLWSLKTAPKGSGP